MVSERPPVSGGVAPPRPRTFRRNCGDQVFITSPSTVYIGTSAKSTHYSQNDEARAGVEETVKLIEVLEQKCWLSVRTVLRDGEIEIQDLIAFIECESSESGHLYESLEPAPAPPGLAPRARTPLDDDFDSFDSDSDEDEHDKSTQAPPLPASRLPSPPSGGQYTLTKIASAAQKKMRQIKRNLTKRYTVAMDGKPFSKAVSPGVYDAPKAKSPIYANCERPDIQHPYSNVTFNDTRPVLKTDSPKPNGFREELKTALSEKRLSNGDAPPLPEKTLEKPLEKPTTPTTEAGKKDSGTLSRKAYFSFKSRFRRATSLAVDMNDVPGALKITNSTFYLTDSMDGDSGFSNCDNGQTGSAETLSPVSARGRRRDGTRRAWADSTPCLALPRPSAPPPPPPAPPAASQAPPTAQAPPTTAVATPPAAPPTDLSAVNEGNAQASTDQRL